MFCSSYLFKRAFFLFLFANFASFKDFASVFCIFLQLVSFLKQIFLLAVQEIFSQMFVVGCYELFQHESHHQLLLVFFCQVRCSVLIISKFFSFATQLNCLITWAEVRLSLFFFHNAKTKSKFDLFLIPKEFVLAYNDDWMCGWVWVWRHSRMSSRAGL